MRLRQEGVTFRELQGETVLLDLRNSAYLRSNAMGTFVLKLLADECSHDQLVAAIVEHFEVPPARAAADLDSFLASLRTTALLEEAS